PTVVIHHGTILLDDQQASPGCPPLELDDVNLTLLNDPVSTITIEGDGRSDLFGPVQFRVVWQRYRQEVMVAGKGRPPPVGPALVGCLGRYFAEIGEHARQLEGVAGLQAVVSYRPDPEQPWSHDIHWHLGQSRLRHPYLPVALDGLEADIRCQDGNLTVE